MPDIFEGAAERDLDVHRAPNSSCAAEAEAVDNEPDRGAWCNATSPRGWYCTRPEGHEGVHIAIGNRAVGLDYPLRVVDRWGWADA